MKIFDAAQFTIIFCFGFAALSSAQSTGTVEGRVTQNGQALTDVNITLTGTRLGGVVNIITKNPSTTPSFSANAYRRSTTREGSINLAASPESGRFKSFVSGDLTRQEHFFDNNNDGFNDQANQSRVAFFGKGLLAGKEGEQRFNVAAKYLNENRTGGVRGFSDDIRGSTEIYGESIYTRRAELLTEYRPAGLNEQLRFNSALTYHSQDSYYGNS